MLRSGLINMIREKTRDGKSAYAIGHELGIAENTAKKYANGAPSEHGLKGRVKESKLDPFKPSIDGMVGQGIFNCVVLLERLREIGYDAGSPYSKNMCANTGLQETLRQFAGTKPCPASRHRWIGA
jgi:hypothetical protein